MVDMVKLINVKCLEGLLVGKVFSSVVYSSSSSKFGLGDLVNVLVVGNSSSGGYSGCMSFDSVIVVIVELDSKSGMVVPMGTSFLSLVDSDSVVSLKQDSLSVLGKSCVLV